MNSPFYYASWSLMIIVTIWLGFEVKIWSNFLREIRKTFFNILLSLIIIFTSINIVGLVYSINYPSNTFSEVVRTYFPVLSIVVLAFMMRIVNNRSINSNSKSQSLLRDAARHIAYKNSK